MADVLLLSSCQQPAREIVSGPRPQHMSDLSLPVMFSIRDIINQLELLLAFLRRLGLILRDIAD